MKEWWLNLSLREKQAAIVGGIIVGIFILYKGLWAPLEAATMNKRQQLQQNQTLLAWMISADKILKKAANSAHPSSPSTTPVDLLSFLQAQINDTGLAPNLTQLKQGANETIEMQFQKVDFDKLASLLITVVKQRHLLISQMSASTIHQPGLVNAEVVLVFSKIKR